MPRQSAGLLLYRKTPRGLEVFLVHPGGPFWARKDEGDQAAWFTIPLAPKKILMGQIPLLNHLVAIKNQID